MRNLRALGALLLVASVAGGCSAPSIRPAFEGAPATNPDGARLPATALPVPIVRQATSYSCGAAALMACLYYWRAYDGKESSLYEACETSEDWGTEPRSLVRVAESYGLDAVLRKGLELADLRAALGRGDTAILSVQAWRGEEGAATPWKETWGDGHYVVLVGMDARFAYVMDPSSPAGYAYVPLAELEDRWHDAEARHGKREEYVHAAVLIRGRSPLRSIPGPLWRME